MNTFLNAHNPTPQTTQNSQPQSKINRAYAEGVMAAHGMENSPTFSMQDNDPVMRNENRRLQESAVSSSSKLSTRRREEHVVLIRPVKSDTAVVRAQQQQVVVKQTVQEKNRHAEVVTKRSAVSGRSSSSTHGHAYQVGASFITALYEDAIGALTGAAQLMIATNDNSARESLVFAMTKQVVESWNGMVSEFHDPHRVVARAQYLYDPHRVVTQTGQYLHELRTDSKVQGRALASGAEMLPWGIALRRIGTTAKVVTPLKVTNETALSLERHSIFNLRSRASTPTRASLTATENVQSQSVKTHSDKFNLFSRRATARSFYVEMGWAPERIESHLAGIDFDKYVKEVVVPRNTILVQYQIPGYNIGNYFTFLTESSNRLGIYAAGRLRNEYMTLRDVRMLESITSNTIDWWSMKEYGWHIETDGGAKQLFTSDLSAFGAK